MGNRLEGKRVLFVGAATGIGRETVKLFATEGAKIVIGDNNKEAGKLVAEEAGAHFEFCDIADEKSVAHLVEAAAHINGGLDVVVNNAAIQYSGNVTDFDAEKWDRIFQINARGPFLVCKYAIPYLRQSKNASIVNTSSVAGVRGGPGMTAYSATKGAVIAFTTALALELVNDGIRVNAVCPGWVDTPFNNPAIGFMGGSSAQQKLISEFVPMGRQAVPSEIAPLFVYLASDESSYMTAKSIAIDGGVVN